MSETRREYAANYREPPVHTRFKKGQKKGHSGDLAGRQKCLHCWPPQHSTRRGTVTENGKRRQITKREAVSAQLVNKSASAELRATKMLIDMLRAGQCSEPGCLFEELPVPPRMSSWRL